MRVNGRSEDPVLTAVCTAVRRTFAEQSARVGHSVSTDPGASVPPGTQLPDLDFRELGCVDFRDRRSRLGDQFPRVVAEDVEYHRVAGGRWRRYSLQPGTWPQMHPCYFLEGLVAHYRSGRERADGCLELELDPAIVPQVPDARPSWQRAAANLTCDEHGRVARLTVRLSAPDVDAWFESEFEFADFGTPCEANPPAAEHTVSFDEWMESLMERPPG